MTERSQGPRGADENAETRLHRVPAPRPPGHREGPVGAGPGLEQALEGTAGIDILLVGMALDSSFSIHKHENSQAVRDGPNGLVARLQRIDATVRLHVQDLDGRVYSDFCDVRDAVDLTRENYRPAGPTALYDGTCRVIDELRDRRDRIAERGRVTRAICVVLTDGADTSSKKRDAPSTADRIRAVRATGDWLVLGMGFSGEVDFRPVFEDMGIPPEFVITSSRQNDEIKRGFDTITKLSILSASSAGDFRKTTLMGFGALDETRHEHGPRD